MTQADKSRRRIFLYLTARCHKEFYPAAPALVGGPIELAILQQVRDLVPFRVLEDSIDQASIFGLRPARIILAHVIIGELVAFVRRIFRPTAEDSHKMLYQALEKILYMIFRALQSSYKSRTELGINLSRWESNC